MFVWPLFSTALLEFLFLGQLLAFGNGGLCVTDQAEELVVFNIGAADFWTGGGDVFVGIAFVGEEGDLGDGELFFGFVEGDFGQVHGACDGQGSGAGGHADEGTAGVDGKGAATGFEDKVGFFEFGDEESVVGADEITDASDHVIFVLAVVVRRIDVDFFAADD